MRLQIDQENEAEEAASKLPSTNGDVHRSGDVQDAEASASANGTDASQPTAVLNGETEGKCASGVTGQAATNSDLDSETHLQRNSSRSRRSLYRESFGVHSPEYAADCGSIEEPDPSSSRGIERVSAARLDGRRSGSLSRPASLGRDRSLSGSFKRIAGRS